MLSISDFKEDFLKLNYANQIEIYYFISNAISNHQTQKLSLKEAAEKLKENYKSDKELTVFQSIENDFYE